MKLNAFEFSDCICSAIAAGTPSTTCVHYTYLSSSRRRRRLQESAARSSLLKFLERRRDFLVGFLMESLPELHGARQTEQSGERTESQLAVHKRFKRVVNLVWLTTSNLTPSMGSIDLEIVNILIHKL